MQKLQNLEPERLYWIRHTGNNREPLFLENKNYTFFIQLMQRHLVPVCEIVAYALIETELHFVLKTRSLSDIPPRYHDRLHQPLSNLFNAYCKAFNKEYGRSGSLFRVRYQRNGIEDARTLQHAVRQTHLLPARNGHNFRYYPYSSYPYEKQPL